MTDWVSNFERKHVLTPARWIISFMLGTWVRSGGARQITPLNGGNRPDCRALEQVLDRHPAVDASVVYAVTDPKWGERVEAAVVLKNGADVSVEDLQDFVRGQIASYKLPKVTRIVESLPLTANNKPDRRALRAAAERSSESSQSSP